ncbi:MAG: NUDIX hydrolase [Cyclobacteriaceae bacterium]
MTYQDYKDHQFTLAVDCIIFGFSGRELNILLIHRGFDPGKGLWSLMGGFVKNDESLDDAPKRILKDLTGLRDVYLEQVHTYGHIHRDPGDRVVSVAYFALIRKDDHDQKLLDEHNAKWFPLDEYPDLIFDHGDMINAAKRQMHIHARLQPIGFNLLPPKFTLPELQYLYESIYGQKLDDRNFRRRVLTLGILKKTTEKKKDGSKKGAFLFEFDKDAYQRLRDDTQEMKALFTLF